ncbi:MAG: DUF3429 domain-containing protein [Gammaproteobacteria bacterium]|nr:DUF3429 domain-containing protein [Gammaproteobacteria bacterium]
MAKRPVHSALMLLGAMPFLACALLPLTGVTEIDGLGRLDQLAASYGMAILCFLTGIHWATQLYASEAAPFNLFVGSNVVFLVVWIAYVAAGLQWAIVAQLLAFPVLLAIDYRLCQAELISRQYLRLRTVATVLAWFSLAVILVS